MLAVEVTVYSDESFTESHRVEQGGLLVIVCGLKSLTMWMGMKVWESSHTM